ncbi:MAG: NADH:flavin oxidoreductase [Candidatus Thorarchaeota archaeon]
MRRTGYKMFFEGNIAGLSIPNRLVRSSTWDPSILRSRKMSKEVISLYQKLALGGVGLIITGGLSAFDEVPPESKSKDWILQYEDVCVESLEELPEIIHSSNTNCKVIAQVEDGKLDAMPSPTTSLITKKNYRELEVEEIQDLVRCYVKAIEGMMNAGFDGVQLHAAHGSVLNKFFSPYFNRREDRYGGSIHKRVEIIREIIEGARLTVGNFPILIKMNCTENLVGGTDIDTFPELAKEIERTGIDAIEISGGTWECLLRSEEDLGFRPVPLAESHTQIGNPDKQSYFLEYAEKLDVDIPLILVGGNRDVEKLETIIERGIVDFVALSRPLIREPDLPNRWFEGIRGRKSKCISCNSCVYSMFQFPDRLVTCVHKNNRSLHFEAQDWLSNWVKRVSQC